MRSGFYDPSDRHGLASAIGVKTSHPWGGERSTKKDIGIKIFSFRGTKKKKQLRAPSLDLLIFIALQEFRNCGAELTACTGEGRE